jgi:hypothetical protein
VNLTGGYWRRIRPANDRARHDIPNEGLFLDARVGFKMLSLPDQVMTSPSFGGTSVTPFTTVSLSGRFAHSVYGSDDTQKGLFEAAFGVLWNGAADSSLSSAFSSGLLSRNTYALSGSVALQLKGSLAITITASPWSTNGSATPLGRNYQIGIKLLNDSKS